jgi:NitT/TauT family transport system substrate-binding protein
VQNVIRALVFAFAGVALSGPAAFAQQKTAPTNVRLAIIPVTNYTPLTVARDKGWFAEEGLNVTWSPVAQGAVAVEAVYGGSVEFGGSSIFEPMVARGNGLDIMLAVPGTRIRPTPPDNSALLVRSGDSINKAADLVGKKISAGLINSVNYVHMQWWLEKQGVDPKKVEFLEIPFPQMPDALFQSRLDAVWAVEPFLTFMMKTGKARILALPYQDNMPGMDITGYVAKESWLKANADVARRFKRVIERATDYLNKAPKEERDSWVAKFTGMKPEVAAAMTLPDFTTQWNVKSLQDNLDLAVKYRMAKKFDVSTMIWKP